MKFVVLCVIFFAACNSDSQSDFVSCNLYKYNKYLSEDFKIAEFIKLSDCLEVCNEAAQLFTRKNKDIAYYYCSKQ